MGSVSADSYRLKDYVADIVSFLEQVVEEPAILFGHSLGGTHCDPGSSAVSTPCQRLTNRRCAI